MNFAFFLKAGRDFCTYCPCYSSSPIHRLTKTFHKLKCRGGGQLVRNIFVSFSFCFCELLCTCKLVAYLDFDVVEVGDICAADYAVLHCLISVSSNICKLFTFPV